MYFKSMALTATSENHIFAVNNKYNTCNSAVLILWEAPEKKKKIQIESQSKQPIGLNF